MPRDDGNRRGQIAPTVDHDAPITSDRHEPLDHDAGRDRSRNSSGSRPAPVSSTDPRRPPYSAQLSLRVSAFQPPCSISCQPTCRQSSRASFGRRQGSRAADRVAVDRLCPGKDPRWSLGRCSHRRQPRFVLPVRQPPGLAPPAPRHPDILVSPHVPRTLSIPSWMTRRVAAVLRRVIHPGLGTYEGGDRPSLRRQGADAELVALRIGQHHVVVVGIVVCRTNVAPRASSRDTSSDCSRV